MPIRYATPLDEPAISALCTAAFFDEGLFGSCIHPYRHMYPDDVQIFWDETIRKYFTTGSNFIIVATRVENEKEIIAGVAIWQRQGNDEGAIKAKERWIGYRPDAFAPLPERINRALDPTKRNVLEESMPYSEHLWAGTRANNWYLSLCATHPDYQGKGIGRELVAWGLDRARKENVHASVISSAGNDAFYLSCGFDEVVGNATAGEGNPINGVIGGNVLFMWPKTKRLGRIVDQE